MRNKYIHNIKELARELGVARDKGIFREIESVLYKCTNCGMIISKIYRGVSLSSIVEGVDASTESYDLHYPFPMTKFRAYQAAVESDANEIWDETHGCEKCSPEGELGYHRINPKCKACKGEGVVL